MTDLEPKEPRKKIPGYTPPSDLEPRRTLAEPDPDYDQQHGYLPKPGEKKDPLEEFRNTAIRFALLEEEIAQLGRTYKPKKGDRTNDKYFRVDVLDDDVIAIVLEPAPIGDADGSIIHFNTIDREFDGAAPEGTKYSLEIEFTLVDRELGEKVIEKALEASSNTKFYFNDTGEYVKIGTTSSEVQEPTGEGSKLLSEKHGQKQYELKMEADDFELAGVALMLLLKELEPEKKLQK